jgi:uncharacterized protein YjcR
VSREPSPEQKRALNIWLKDRTKKPKEIAEEVGVSAALVRKWKSLGKWEATPLKCTRGAPRGNKNAKGNSGGAPEGNENNLKHGLFRKFMPDDPETLEIFDATAELDPLEILWTSIRIQWTNIIRAQKIQHVTNKEEMIKELKKRKYEVHDTGVDKPNLEQVVTEEEYEFQFSWDRQATSLTSQAAAMTNLTRMLKQYDDMLRALPVKEVKAEQRKRFELLKAQVDKTKAEAKTAGKGSDKTPLHITVDYGDDEP